MRCSGISEDLETSVSPWEWVCSDFCGAVTPVLISLLKVSGATNPLFWTKCLIMTIVLVVMLVLIPFFLVYRLLFQLTTQSWKH